MKRYSLFTHLTLPVLAQVGSHSQYGFCFMAKFKVMSEIWKDVKGYEGYYQVSNFGNVRSLPRECVDKHGTQVFKGRLLKQYKSKRNYKYVRFSKLNKSQGAQVHRIVAIHFLPNEQNKPQVNHIDGNPSNNHVDNLEWCTGSENMIHAVKTGLQPIKRGEQVYNAKLKDADIIEIRAMLKDGIWHKHIAEKYNVARETITSINRGKLWKHVS